MVNALVIRPNTQLAKAQKTLRAAQYVRMSTDRQRYSIENQAAVIAAFAQMHNLSIVRTYRDEGESGLKLKNRTGLVQLLDDVQSGRADFSQILVYDVSRWGRFQDTDESAHYEFICKRAGVKVCYCAEMFDNDGSLISSIVKNLKRVMAAEYSRELSVKVHAGQCRLASLGFKQGGPAVYALRRELVDPGMQSKGLLTRGERKYLHTDRVRLRPGPPHEAATLNWIFQQYVTGQKSAAEIARQLNQKAIPSPYAQSWNSRLLCRLLRNENYIGNLVFNRMSRHLGQNAVSNPRDHWIRSVGAIEPMVDQKLFLRAQKILDARRVDLSEEEMLVRLRATLKKHGRLSTAIINETVGLPSTATFMAHFGSIRNAYRLIGYISKRDCDWIDSDRLWSQEVARLVSKVADAFACAGRQISIDSTGNSLSTSDGVSISFRIARCGPGRTQSHSPRWSVYREKHLSSGWVIAVRLVETNKIILDYLLLPTSSLVGRMIRFTDKARSRHNALRFNSIFMLARSLIRRITTVTRAASSKQRRPKQSRTQRQPKTRGGRARR